MPAKKPSKKSAHETTCPTLATEPPAADAEIEQDCCHGACPIDKPPVVPENPVPAGNPSEQTMAAGSEGVLQNETEIVAEEKPPKKPRKMTKKNTAGEKKSSKAPNAYMLFYQDELKKDTYTGIALTERAKMIGALWRQMDDSARAPFKERVAKAKEALTTKEIADSGNTCDHIVHNPSC
jgi:hypothetical protein